MQHIDGLGCDGTRLRFSVFGTSTDLIVDQTTGVLLEATSGSGTAEFGKAYTMTVAEAGWTDQLG